jgi:PII-like signaling protein
VIEVVDETAKIDAVLPMLDELAKTRFALNLC